MDRARDQRGAGEGSLPRGLRRRRNAGGDVIQIAFTFKGIECREVLRLNPDNPKDVKAAVSLRGEILRRIELGTFRYVDYFPDSPRAVKFGHIVSKKTMKELLEGALTAFKKAAELGNLAHSTVDGYRKIIQGELLPFFGHMALRDVSPAVVRQWIMSLTCTTKTARNRISLLRSVFDDAVEDGLLDQNPLMRIATKKVLARTTKRSTFEVDPCDHVEQEAILQAAAKRAPQAKNLFQFGFWSGLRISELMGLQWEDIDFIHGVVRVNRAIVLKKLKNTTKTPAGTRDVYLLPAARAALEAQKEHTFLEGKQVFHNPYTRRHWETDKQVRMVWTSILKAAGVRYRNPYQVRHTYACMMLSHGENELWVARQLGHDGVETVRRHYGKKWIPKKGAVIPTLNDWSHTA